MKSSIKINEIFYSIQGESTFAGLPCVFIRLTGCNLRCNYCDTTYALEEGEKMTLDEIIAKVNSFPCQLVEITGGEPLLQWESYDLANRLRSMKKQVLIETNGSFDISALREPIVRIMDFKCPSSGEEKKMNWNNIQHLRPGDNVKFVIANRQDFDWSVEVVKKYDLLTQCEVLFSAVFAELELKELANWLLETALPIRLQLQLHKYVWRRNRRGV